MSTTLQTSGIGSVYIQNLAFSGNSIIATNTNGSIDFVPNGTGAIGFGNVGFNNGVISTTLDNLDIVLSPDGTGVVKTDNLQLDGNTISTTNVDGNLVLTPNGNGNVGIGNSSPNAKLHVQGSFMQNDTLGYFVRKTMPSVSLLGTYNYVLLGKAATVSGVNMPASYAIGKIVFRRGDTNAYNFVDVIHVMSSRGYDNETFSANIEHCGTGTTPSNVPNGTKFVRLVKCTYDSIEYHAVEISGSGGNNTHEQTFEGYSVDAGLLYVGEGVVSNVTSYGNLGVVSHTNGNVGIGISSPSQKLHVDGYQTFYDSTLLPGQNTTGSDLVPSKIILGNEYGPQIRTRYPNGGWTDRVDLEFWTAGQNIATDSSSSRLTIKALSGNVGVGTTSPLCGLDIQTAGTRCSYPFGIGGNSTYAFYTHTRVSVSNNSGGWSKDFVVGQYERGGWIRVYSGATKSHGGGMAVQSPLTAEFVYSIYGNTLHWSRVSGSSSISLSNVGYQTIRVTVSGGGSYVWGWVEIWQEGGVAIF